MSWELQVQSKNIYHVVPADDLVLHEAQDDCVCGPAQSETGSGELVYQHFPLDGRNLPTYYQAK